MRSVHAPRTARVSTGYVCAQEVSRKGLLDPELGKPTTRRPRTALLNFVKYHTEVVAALTYHFVKLSHNVSIFSRDDNFEIDDVLTPYFWKGVKCVLEAACLSCALWLCIPGNVHPYPAMHPSNPALGFPQEI